MPGKGGEREDLRKESKRERGRERSETKKERRKKGLGLVQSAPFGEEEEDPAGAPATRPDPERARPV